MGGAVVHIRASLVVQRPQMLLLGSKVVGYLIAIFFVDDIDLVHVCMDKQKIAWRFNKALSVGVSFLSPQEVHLNLSQVFLSSKSRRMLVL